MSEQGIEVSTCDMGEDMGHSVTVNSRAKFTTHSRVMFTSDDRVDVYHINDNHADLAFNKASFLRESWR